MRAVRHPSARAEAFQIFFFSHFSFQKPPHFRSTSLQSFEAYPPRSSAISRDSPIVVQFGASIVVRRLRRLRRCAPIVRGLRHTSEKVCPNHMAKGNPVLLVSARLNGIYFAPVDRLVLRCSYHFKYFVLAKNFIPAYAHLWRMQSAALVPTIHAQRRSRAEVVPPDVATFCEWHRIYLLFFLSTTQFDTICQ